MRYRLEYQATHDIDWFFRARGLLFHVASNGGRIPDSIDSRENRRLQESIERMPIIAVPRIVASNENDQEDLSSFAEFASKGFISLDRLDGEFEQQEYRVVAIPSQCNNDNSSSALQGLLNDIPEFLPPDMEFDDSTRTIFREMVRLFFAEAE